MGWDDAECEDDETFKDILRFIDKYNITQVFICISTGYALKKAYKKGFLVKISRTFGNTNSFFSV